MNKVYAILCSGSEWITGSGSSFDNELCGIYDNIEAAKQHIKTAYDRFIEEKEKFGYDYDISISDDGMRLKRDGEGDEIECKIIELEPKNIFTDINDGFLGHINYMEE